MMERTQAERERIERATMRHSEQLIAGDTLLGELELSHQRGLDWVPLNDAKLVAVRVLQACKAIEVIRFNDGEHYARITGAFVI